MSTVTVDRPVQLTVERINDEAALAGLAVDWNALAREVPFRQFEWLEAWWRHFRTRRDRLFLLAVRDTSGELVGLAPWYLHSSRYFGRRLQFLGDREVASDYMSLLAADGMESTVAAEVAGWLKTNCHEWDAIDLEGVDVQDETMVNLATAIAARGMHVSKHEGLACWRLEFPTTWNDYVQCLSKSRRERVRKLIRRQFDTGRAQFHQAETLAEVERGLEILVELHQLRRRSTGDRGCFACDQFEPFLREVAKRFHQLGRLRLHWLEIEGRPAAVGYELTGNATVYFYQSGMDPELAGERPGWLEKIASLRSAIESGFQCYDFLRGNEEYKSHWRAQPRPAIRLRAVSDTPTARRCERLSTSKEQIERWCKQKVKAWLGRRSK